MTQRPSSARIRVLVVDDDQSFAEMTAAFLKRDHEHWAVETAPSAEAALDRLEVDDGFDCVVSDYEMPGADGLEFLEAVQADDLDLPSILFTGRGSEEIRDRGLGCRVAMVTAIEPDVDVLEMEFDDYVTKPVTKPEIRRTVAELIDLQRHDDLVQEYFQLASKLAALDASTAAMELDANDAYRSLVERYDEVRSLAGDRLDGLIEEDGGRRAIRGLLSDRDVQPDGGLDEMGWAASDD